MAKGRQKRFPFKHYYPIVLIATTIFASFLVQPSFSSSTISVSVPVSFSNDIRPILIESNQLGNNPNQTNLVGQFAGQSSSSSVSFDSAIDPSSSDGWETVTDQWPHWLRSEKENLEQRSGENSDSVPFFFNNDDRLESKLIRLQFTNSFVDNLKSLNTTLEINFMIWIGSKSSKSSSIEVNLSERNTINILEQYFPQFSGLWMPVQYRLDSSEIHQFQIDILSGHQFVAFKQFNVKYDKLIIKNPENPDRNPLETISVAKLCLPPSANHSAISQILYFPDCKDLSCIIMFQTKSNSSTTKNFLIDFEYWNDLSVDDKDPVLSPIKFTLNGQQLPIRTNQVDRKIWQKYSIEIVAPSSTNGSSLSSDLKLEFIMEYENDLKKRTFCPSLALKINKVSPLCSHIDECVHLVDHSKSTVLSQFDFINKFANDSSSTFPTTLYYSLESFSQYQIPIQLESPTIDEICINLEYINLDLNLPTPKSQPIYLTVQYGLGVEQSFTVGQFELEKIPLESNFNSNPEDYFQRTICLGDYLYLSSKNYSLVLQFESEPGSDAIFLFNWNLFRKFQDKSMKVLNFVSSFEVNDTTDHEDNEWQQNWNDDFEQFDEYFEFNDNSILFNVSSSLFEHTSLLHPNHVTLSSRWIRYSSVLTQNSPPVYRLQFGSQAETKQLTVTPRICDQLDHCTWLPMEPILDQQSSLTLDYRFGLNYPPATRLFRLEFIFEFYFPPSSPPTPTASSIAVQFKLLYFGHPCYQLPLDESSDTTVPIGPAVRTNSHCKNNGICMANVFETIDNPQKQVVQCECPDGFYGKECELIEGCRIPLMEHSNITGNEICSQRGLECQSRTNEPQPFVCVCLDQPDNRIIWNSETKMCQNRPVELVKYPKSSENKFPIEISNFNQLDPLNSIVYHFDSDEIPRHYDLCFQMNWTSFSMGYLLDNSDLSAVPTLYVYYGPKGQLELPLFRHLLVPSMSTNTTSTIEFCVGSGFLFPGTIQNYNSFLIRFHLDLFYLGSNLEEINFKMRIDSISLELKKTEDELNKDEINVMDYNRRYWNKLQQLKSWKVISSNAVLREISNASKIEIENSDPNQLWSGLNLVSDWFVFNSLYDSVQISYQQYPKSIPYCQLHFQPLKVISLTKDLKYHNYTLNLEQNKDEQILFYRGLAGPMVSGMYFRLILEIQTFNCSGMVNLDSLIKMIEPCKQKKCLNDGVCKDNYLDGTGNCQCGTKYTGDRCERINQCSVNQTRLYCSRFASETVSPSGVSQPNSCLPLSNGGFKCRCWPGQFDWDSSSQSCIPVYEYERVKRHLAPSNKENNFLQNVIVNDEVAPSGVFKWMDRSGYWNLIKNQKFYFALSDQFSTLSFDLSSLNQNQDLCVWIEYWTESEGSWIGIGPLDHSHSGNSTSNLIWTNQNQKTQICLAHSFSTKGLVGNFKIGAKFNRSNSDAIVAFRLLNQTVTESSDSLPVSYIPAELNKELGDFERFWPIQFPSNRPWKFVNYSINFSNENDANSPNQFHLVSAWIEMYRGINTHRLQFNLNCTNIDGSILRPIVFDSSMNDISEKLIIDYQNYLFGDSKRNSLVKNCSESMNVSIDIRLNSNETGELFYRIGFQVSTTVGKGPIEFRLSNLNLDDFCIDDQFNPVDCQHSGQCKSYPHSLSALKYQCQCKQGYTGVNCEIVDHCTKKNEITGKSGNEICRENFKQPKCFNELLGFKCQCDENWYWNHETVRCHPISSCLTNQNQCDQVNEICVDQFDQETKQSVSKCYCNYQDGYGRNRKTNRCQLLDPCDRDVLPENQSLLESEELNAKPKCGPNTKCFAPYRGANATAFSCYCPKGLELKLESSTNTYVCESRICNSPFWNPCQQRCEPTGEDSTGYRCLCFPGYSLVDKNSCQPKTRPPCPQDCTADGSYCNFETKHCECSKINFEYVANYSGPGTFDACIPKDGAKFADCPYGNYSISNETGRISCYCDGDLFIQNSNEMTCDLRLSCMFGGKGDQECSRKDALCLPEIGSLAGFRCRCRPGQHLISITSNTTNGTLEEEVCREHCQDSSILSKCKLRNAQCNPLALVDLDADQRSRTEQNWSELCRCGEGFHRVKDKNLGFRCEFGSTFFQTRLLISKSSYLHSSQFQQSTNQERQLFLLDNSIAQSTQSSSSFDLDLEKLNTEIWYQFLVEFNQSKRDNLKQISQNLKQLEMLEIRSIVDRLLNYLIVHYTPMTFDPAIIIQNLKTVQCEEYSDDYIECQLELYADQVSSKPKTSKQKLFFQQKITSIFSQTLFEMCHQYHDESNVNGQLLIRKSPESQNCILLHDSNQTTTETFGNYFDQSLLILSLDSVKQQSELLHLFRPCLRYSSKCPQFSYCVDHQLDSSFGCKCRNSSLLLETNSEIVDKSGQPLTECKIKDTASYCPKSRYRTGQHDLYNLMPIDQELFGTVNCSCNPELAISIQYDEVNQTIAKELGDDGASKPDHSVSIGNWCVDKDLYFCYKFRCLNGKCRNEADPCQCLSGWTGDHCDQEDNKSRLMFIAWLVLAAVAFLVTVLLVAVYLRERHKRRNNDSFTGGEEYVEEDGSGFDIKDDRVMQFFPVNGGIGNKQVKLIEYKSTLERQHIDNRGSTATVTKTKPKYSASSKVSNSEVSDLNRPSTSRQFSTELASALSARANHHHRQISLSTREFSVNKKTSKITTTTTSDDFIVSSADTDSSIETSIEKSAKPISIRTKKDSKKSEKPLVINPAVVDMVRSNSKSVDTDLAKKRITPRESRPMRRM